MTLCAVWKDSNGLQLASDSRLGIGSTHVDTSVKVTTFPILVLEPSFEGWSDRKALLRQEIGLCAAGDVAPTMALKECLRTVMSSIWIVPGRGNISMESFAQLVSSMLRPLWYQAASQLGNDVAAQIGIAGFCPEQQRERAFMLRTDTTSFPATIHTTEIDLAVGPVFFGSGRREAETLLSADPLLSPPRVIKRVAEDPRVTSVGGRVQYGKVVGRDFQVFSVYDHEVNHQEKTFVGGYYLAGLELVEDSALPLPEGFLIIPTAVDPFQAEREELVKAGYQQIAKYSHFLALFGP
jgi:hypothetical protein